MNGKNSVGTNMDTQSVFHAIYKENTIFFWNYLQGNSTFKLSSFWGKGHFAKPSDPLVWPVFWVVVIF